MWGAGAPRAPCLTAPPASLTDAVELWSTCLSPDSLATLVRNSAGMGDIWESSAPVAPSHFGCGPNSIPGLGSLEVPSGSRVLGC